jgi:glutamyl-tRNA synthetase
LKRSSLQFYDAIKEDLKWLGCRWDEEHIQSDRLSIYYEHAKRLVEMGSAYVCTCSKDLFTSKVSEGKPCPCRDLAVSDQIARWKKMLSGGYDEGEAVVRIKTDLKHPNPAVIDWPALRVIDTDKNPHPRIGAKYRVWPLYNFAAGIDDHLMGITHIIRGKEHYTNTVRQKYMYEYLGWRYPEAIHYGRLKVIGAELSKSKILKRMSDSLVEGFDDPRLATLVALRRRGISPECLRKVVVDIGPRPVDATLSWDNIYAYNRKILDPTSNRYFYVENPIRLEVTGVSREYVSTPLLHPNHPDRTRKINVKPQNGAARLVISESDQKLLGKNRVVRLMELFNVEILKTEHRFCEARLHSETYEESKKFNAPLIHWLPEDESMDAKVVMPTARVSVGLVEPMLSNEAVGDMVQLTRFGFARIDEVAHESIRLYFAHE